MFFRAFLTQVLIQPSFKAFLTYSRGESRRSLNRKLPTACYRTRNPQVMNQTHRDTMLDSPVFCRMHLKTLPCGIANVSPVFSLYRNIFAFIGAFEASIDVECPLNGRKFSKRVENIVGKREIARCEQFLFSHSVFYRIVLQTSKNQGWYGKGIRRFVRQIRILRSLWPEPNTSYITTHVQSLGMYTARH